MRVVVQRVSRAAVEVDGDTVGSIGPGLCLLVGVGPEDTSEDVSAMAEKVAHLRVFADEEGRMNRSLLESGGSILVVSQFTLLADVSRGRRPSFTGAADPERASKLIAELVAAFDQLGVVTEQGRFGAKMRVSLDNEGPVTVLIDVNEGRVS